MLLISLLIIFLSATAKAYDEKVSCKVSTNQEYGRSCRLENVNLETMSRLRVEIDTKSLKYVYFELSEIESFSEEFMKQLRGVEYFNANDVGLERLDKRSLRWLEEMTIFWGGFNQIKRLEANVFSENKNLEAIHLKFNQIGFVHRAAFDGLTNLYILDLSSNNLKALDDIFGTLTNLVKLDLSSNMIERFHKKVFKGLENLVDIILMKNNLKFLDPEVYEDLRNIEFINISFNKSPLKAIPGDLFKQNSHLKQIYLVANNIQAIDPEFLEHSKLSLEVISFRKNSCVDDDVLAVENEAIEMSEKHKLSLCFEKHFGN